MLRVLIQLNHVEDDAGGMDALLHLDLVNICLVYGMERRLRTVLKYIDT